MSIKLEPGMIATYVFVAFILGAILLFILSFFIGRPPQDPDALWPENGDVIAIIDGKEYRYDPVYLYRLTGSCFSEDYTDSPDALGGSFAFRSYLGIYSGETQAEAAVCLELLYREGREDLTEEELVPIKGYESERQKEKASLNPEVTSKAAIHLPRYRESKFNPLQTYYVFVKTLRPYLEKFAYIDEASAQYSPGGILKDDSFLKLIGMSEDEFWEVVQGKDGRRKILDILGPKLIEKHNVQMVE